MTGSEKPPLADEQLLEHIANADVGAFELLYARYSRAFFSTAYALLGEVGKAAEATQEAFLAVWQQAARFDPQRGRGRAWLLSVAHHKAVDAIRRARIRDAVPLLTELQSGEDLVQQTLSKLQGEHVRRALADVSPAQREVLVLAYYGGLTQQEISEVLKLPLGTVKTRARDGLLKLRARIGEQP